MQLLDAYGLTDRIGKAERLRDHRRRGRGLPAGDRGDAVTEGRAVADREKAGEAARAHAPLSGVAVWRPSKDRPDPVALLEEQSATRIPDLVPVRYGRMSASPFAFYRGAALPMAADLATVPVSGFQTQLCGDAHLSNFGLFASPERDLEFDVTDFDETLVGPWEWDLLRLAASLVVSSRVRGFDAHKAQQPFEPRSTPTRLGCRAMRRCARSTSTTRRSTRRGSSTSSTRARGPISARPSSRRPTMTRSTSCRRSPQSPEGNVGSSTGPR